MRVPRAGVDNCRVAEPVRLVLELESSDPIAGSLRKVKRRTRSCSGWLGLMSALSEVMGWQSLECG
jgi:hypothetical protein